MFCFLRCSQLAKAFKLIVPPDALNADGSEAVLTSASPSLQPWDKMRYVWQGGLR